MKEITQKNKLLLAMITTMVIVLVGSVSYAYFTATIAGNEEETTITATAGIMNIVFDGGNDINVSNITPSNDPVDSKTFTITGKNTTDLLMPYSISLVVNNNTFSDNAFTYTLASTNVSENGSVIPDIENQVEIPTGAGTHLLGTGSFAKGDNNVHSYALSIYFPNLPDVNQNDDQGATFQAYVAIEAE